MNILLANSDEQGGTVGLSDEGSERQPTVAGYLVYWVALVASACITMLGLWKLFELFM
ncbi:MAG: hypothetical protein Q7T44_12735 [Parvibaculum sp.]|nr:hypothetical protein [Parvibaculum sp.]